ncbi:MAG: EamA family transporter [Candidatus Ranarchaeia archaeon]|jgi:transporter family protein
MVIALLALSIRIILLGFERVFLKMMGLKAREDQSIVVTVVFFGFGAIVLLPLAVLPLLNSLDGIFNAAISSVFYAVGFVFYSASLRRGDVSLVSPLYNFNLVFILGFSVFFLGESFTPFKVLGLVLMFFGLSYLEKGNNIITSLKNVFTQRSCQLMVIASLFISCGRIIDGFTVQSANPLTYAFFIYLFVTIYLLAVLSLRKKHIEIVELVRTAPKLSLASGAVNGLSYLALLIAFTAIEVSIADPASTLNIFIAMLLAARLLKEEVKQRLFATVIIVLGVLFLFI